MPLRFAHRRFDLTPLRAHLHPQTTDPLPDDLISRRHITDQEIIALELLRGLAGRKQRHQHHQVPPARYKQPRPYPAAAL